MTTAKDVATAAYERVKVHLEDDVDIVTALAQIEGAVVALLEFVAVRNNMMIKEEGGDIDEAD